MKICPNCHKETEDTFGICRYCNYILTEQKVINVDDAGIQSRRKINCVRCRIPMNFSGNYTFHEGSRPDIFGNLYEVSENQQPFDLYVCPKCGKVEFFTTSGKP